MRLNKVVEVVPPTGLPVFCLVALRIAVIYRVGSTHGDLATDTYPVTQVNLGKCQSEIVEKRNSNQVGS